MLLDTLDTITLLMWSQTNAATRGSNALSKSTRLRRYDSVGNAAQAADALS